MPEERPTLEYRDAHDDHAEAWQETKRRSRNAGLRGVVFVAVFLGVIVGLANFCWAAITLAQGGIGAVDWGRLLGATAVSFALMWGAWRFAGVLTRDS